MKIDDESLLGASKPKHWGNLLLAITQSRKNVFAKFEVAACDFETVDDTYYVNPMFRKIILYVTWRPESVRWSGAYRNCQLNAFFYGNLLNG